LVPAFQKKLPIPTKFGAEHHDLLRLQDDFGAHLKALKDDKSVDLPKTYQEMKDILVNIQNFLEPHLVEEETVWLPLVLQTFTKDELKVPEKKMMAEMEWYALPHLYRGIATKEQREIHMHKVLGIPTFVIKFLMAGDFSKYDRVYGRPINELKDFSLREKNAMASSASCSCIIS